jgi:hypothetical protein
MRCTVCRKDNELMNNKRNKKKNKRHTPTRTYFMCAFTPPQFAIYVYAAASTKSIGILAGQRHKIVSWDGIGTKQSLSREHTQSSTKLVAIVALMHVNTYLVDFST